MYEQQQLFDENAEEDDIPSEAEFGGSHIRLGSRQRSLKAPTYEQVLHEELGFSDFGDSLATFLHEYALVEVYGLDFDGDGFEGHRHNIRWCKVISSPSTILYVG